jgi:hypothetical protein
MNCKNCTTEVNSNFCPNCGQPTSLKRIDGKYIIQEVGHLLHFEKGIIFTVKELIANPGQTVKNYLLENRSRLVKPVIFIIVTSLIYTLCNHLFHFEDGYVKYMDDTKSTTTEIFKWVQENYGYANIIIGIFIALWTKLFFKKNKFNFFEILILLCFVMGIGMLIFSVFGIIQGLINLNLMQIAGIIGFGYTSWAIGHFFDKTKIASFVKAFFAYILGMLTFSLSALLIGVIIDLIIKS